MPFGPFGQQQPRPGAFGASPMNIPKPPSELAVGETAPSKPISRDITPAPAATTTQSGPPPPVETKPSVPEAVQASTYSGPTATQGVTASQAASPAPGANVAASAATVPTTPGKVPPTGPKSDRIQPAIPIATPAKSTVPSVASPLTTAPVNNAPQQGPSQTTAITEATRAANAAVAAAMAKLPQPGAQPRTPRSDAAVDVATKKLGEMKPFDSNRTPRGGYQNVRGGRGGYRNQYQSHGKKVEVPTTDYDFELANAKFNKQDLVKEAIATGSPMVEGEEHAPNDDEVEPPAPVTDGSSAPQNSSTNGYNKATSFFDNISSEARDREEGNNGLRPGGREWRGEEEKRNIETFGQGSVDGYRNYRSRGRGRGYGRGRGGYGRGYSRGRGGMRGGRSASQSTGVPMQS